MKTYMYSEARQNLASILKTADKEGEVIIKKRNGQTYVLRQVKTKNSPFDIKGIDIQTNSEEILEIIKTSRNR